MKKMNKLVAVGIAAALVLSGCSGGKSAAEKYPERDINMTVPFNPGGSTDLTGRVVGEAMGRNLDTNFGCDKYTGSRRQCWYTECIISKAGWLYNSGRRYAFLLHQCRLWDFWIQCRRTGISGLQLSLPIL